MNHPAPSAADTADTKFRDTDHFLETYPIGTRIAGGFVAGQHPTHPRGILVLAPKASEIHAPWTKAEAHAADLEIDGLKDFRQATRLEGLVVDENLSPRRAKAAAFQDGGEEALSLDRWYWLGQEYEFDSDLAWAQTFDDGNQGGWLKNYALAVRAVRTLFI